MTPEIGNGASRPDRYDIRVSQVNRIVVSGLGSGKEGLKMFQVGSGRVGLGGVRSFTGWVGSGQQLVRVSHVGSGRAIRVSNSCGSSRVRSRRLKLCAGGVGSGDLTQPGQDRPVGFDLTREYPEK